MYLGELLIANGSKINYSFVLTHSLFLDCVKLITGFSSLGLVNN